MRANASNWLSLAEDIWAYRRDLMSEAELAEFVTARGELQKSLQDCDDPGRMKLKIESLESILGRVGGTHYPKSALTENVSFFLVATMIVLSLRAYVVQPFKIPTNSMWPTYSGLVAQPLPLKGPMPGFLENALFGVAEGASANEMVAPDTGNIQIPFFESTRHIAYYEHTVRSWLIFPSRVRDYTFYVNGKPATVSVSADYEDFDFVAMETLFPTLKDTDVAAQEAHLIVYSDSAHLERTYRKASEESKTTEAVTLVTLPTKVTRGDPILRFELLGGDQLLVDRISYNFVRPRVGSAFVFQTGNIPDIGHEDFYIKRLAGLPGDRMEVHPPVLYRNGAPISGSFVFEMNALQRSPYRGYTNIPPRVNGKQTYLWEGAELRVPERSLFAMGDNSHFSADSRYWGYVPEAEVIGRPLLIYYPFTSRWGAAR